MLSAVFLSVLPAVGQLPAAVIGNRIRGDDRQCFDAQLQRILSENQRAASIVQRSGRWAGVGLYFASVALFTLPSA